MGFLDDLFGGGGDDNKQQKKNKTTAQNPNNTNDNTSNNNTGNPLMNAIGNLGKKKNHPAGTFQGTGQSLGGNKPGQVLSITLSEPGPLGIRIEKKSNVTASAIVNDVVSGSQAYQAGLKRGDILCFAGSNGQEEIMYDMFMELATSPQRPLHFEVRRLTTTTASAAASVQQSSSTLHTPNSGLPSADAEARRQAVMAAAEAREKAHKQKTKTIKYVTKTTLEKEKLQNQNSTSSNNSNPQHPISEMSRKAAIAAKQEEAMLAAQLGYNPYQTAKSTAGQARNATTTVQHGNIQGPSYQDGDRHFNTTNSTTTSPEVRMPPGSVISPSYPTTVANMEPNVNSTSTTTSSTSTTTIMIPPEVEEALATVLSSNNSAAISILSKLIINATTKGQPGNNNNKDDDNHQNGETIATAAAKFRKVRLANPKIKAAVVDVEGALDLMMLVGFQFVEDDENGGESCLVFPPYYRGPDWLSTVLERMTITKDEKKVVTATV